MMEIRHINNTENGTKTRHIVNISSYVYEFLVKVEEAAGRQKDTELPAQSSLIEARRF